MATDGVSLPPSLDNPAVAGLDILNGVLGVEVPRLLRGVEERLALQHMRSTPFEVREPAPELAGFENIKMLHVGMTGVCDDVLVDIRRIDGQDMISDMCQNPDDLDAWRQKLQKMEEACPPDHPSRSIHRPSILAALAATVVAGKVNDTVIRQIARVQQELLFDTGPFADVAANAAAIHAKGPGFLFIPTPGEPTWGPPQLAKCIRLRLASKKGLFFDEWLRACAERLDLGPQPLEVAMWDMNKLTSGVDRFEDQLHQCCFLVGSVSATLRALGDWHDSSTGMIHYHREMRAWLHTLPTALTALLSPGHGTTSVFGFAG